MTSCIQKTGDIEDTEDTSELSLSHLVHLVTEADDDWNNGQQTNITAACYRHRSTAGLTSSFLSHAFLYFSA